MYRLDIRKSYKRKKTQEAKHAKKRFKFDEGDNKYIPPPMEI